MNKENMELLKTRVTGKVFFVCAREGCLWYRTDDKWIFPIPFEDTGNAQGSAATFPAEDKAILYMRWIRKHIEFEEEQRRLIAEGIN